MQPPWQIPAYAEPGHVLPLSGGRWRGPTADSRCAKLLAERGICFEDRLADGSAAWSSADWGVTDEAPVVSGPVALDDPHWRAGWIAARLNAGQAAWSRPPPSPRMLGILNLTPDSFSDGGEYLDASGAIRDEALLAAAHRLAEEGAELLDLGAESTRPGAQAVSDAMQLQRLLPAIAVLNSQALPLSIDTRSAVVAEACLQAGATWINDVSGLSDSGMAPLLARTGAPVILMHLRGTPADMREHAHYQHLLGEIADELASRVGRALAAGVSASQIVLDPGIGFAKDAAQSAALVADCGALRALGLPLLLGPSRKSYLATPVGGNAPNRAGDRDAATVDAAAQCGNQGAAWLRLHRGGAALEAARSAHHRAFGLEIPA